MKKINKFIIFTPRIIGILLTFLMFSLLLEGFGESFKWYTPFLVALPGLIMLLATIIAWIWPLEGGIIFILLGLFYGYLASDKFLLSVLVISGSLFLAGILLIIASNYPKQSHKIKEK